MCVSRPLPHGTAGGSSHAGNSGQLACVVSDSPVWFGRWPCARFLSIFSFYLSLTPFFQLSSSLALSFSTSSLSFFQPIYIFLPFSVSPLNSNFSLHFFSLRFSAFFLSENFVSLSFSVFFSPLCVPCPSFSLCHIWPPKLLFTVWLDCLSVAKSSCLSLCCRAHRADIQHVFHVSWGPKWNHIN